QPKQAAIRHLFPDSLQQPFVGNRVEVALQVGIDHVAVTGLEKFLDSVQRLPRPPLGPEAVAGWSEVALEDRLQDVNDGRLHDAVSNRGYAQRALLRASRLGDVDTANRLRPVGSLPQLFPQFPQILVRVATELFDADMIDPRRPLVGHDFRRGRREVGRGEDLVDQTVPNTTFDPQFKGHQHAFGPDRGFRPG